MSKRTISMLLVANMAVMFVGGCGADDETTEDRYERPDQAREIVTDTQLERFESSGVPIYGGNSPPNIAGTYYSGDAVVEFTDSATFPAPNLQWCHKEITYRSAGSTNVYEVSSESVTFGCNSSSSGQANFISGTGDCFTLYRRTTSTFQDCEEEIVGLLSACVNSGGDLVEPLSARLVVKQASDTACEAQVSRGNTLALGELAVFSEKSGVNQKLSD